MFYSITGRVLVTGGAGFLGSHLVARLLECGCEVTVFDAESVAARTYLRFVASHDRFRYVRGDIRSRNDLLRIGTDDWTHVFHLAAQPISVLSNLEPEVTLETNTDGTANVCWFAAEYSRSARMVLASSACVYGMPAPSASPLREDDVLCEGFYAYTASKQGAEVALRQAQGLKCAIARFVNLYGPGDRHFSRVIPKMIRHRLRGERVQLTRGAGESILDFLFVDDAVEALVALAANWDERLGPGETPTYNFGVGAHHARPVLDVVREIARATGDDDGEVDFPQAFSEPPIRKFLDPTKARTELGWRARVELAEGMIRTVDWYRSHIRDIDHLEDRSLPGCLSSPVRLCGVADRPLTAIDGTACGWMASAPE